GRVWGPRQAVDKETALKMFTRWAAEYVLRDKVFGSLEPDKWADFIVIDRDYLAAADEEIDKINVLMTVVAGRTVYLEPAFAKAQNLQPVGSRIAGRP